MILTGDAIIEARRRGDLTIDPFVEGHVGPNSYDVTLAVEMAEYGSYGKGGEWLYARAEGREEVLPFYRDGARRVLDVKRETPLLRFDLDPDAGHVLLPGRLYLGSTVERLGSSRYIPRLSGRSSVGRMGITVHVTAGEGDLGFIGTWTLEIVVVEPVRVYPGFRVAQFLFSTAVGSRARQYNSKYQGQSGPKPSQLWRDFKDGRPLEP